MRRKILLSSVFFILATLGIFFVMGVTKNRVKTESPELLIMNGYSIVKDNGYNYIMNQEEYVVTKDSIQDTIVVRLVKGALIIQPK